MKIYFIANIRFPTEKAHGLQIAKMIEAWQKSGTHITLVVPSRHHHSHFHPTIKSAYSLHTNIKTKSLWCLDLLQYSSQDSSQFIKVISFWLQSLSFSLSLFWFCLSSSRQSTYYTRNVYMAIPLILNRQHFFLEIHHPPSSSIGIWLHRAIFKQSRGVIFISDALSKRCHDLQLQSKHQLIAHDAVDLSSFAHMPSTKTARARLKLPQTKNIVLYTGSFFPEKGVNLLLKATRQFPANVLTIFVGGSPIEPSTHQFMSRAKQDYSAYVLVKPHLLHHQIIDYLAAADVLVLPVSNISQNHYGSPLKLFEYMASKRPIVVSSLPSIREIINSAQAAMIKPDNIHALVAAVNQLLSHPSKSKLLATKAFKQVHQYTWDRRASLINQFILSHA